MTAEHMSALCSAAAAIVSLGALAQARASARRALRPQLVLTYVQGWRIRNVGQGPALNVICSAREVGGPWGHHVRVPALAVGAELALYWAQHDTTHFFRLLFESSDGELFETTCGRERQWYRRLAPRLKLTKVRAALEDSIASFEAPSSDSFQVAESQPRHAFRGDFLGTLYDQHEVLLRTVTTGDRHEHLRAGATFS